VVITGVAYSRRREALSASARDNGYPRGVSRSLARCPACDAPLDLDSSAAEFYCLDHLAEQRDESRS
jgi:hypothetical protein